MDNMFLGKNQALGDTDTKSGENVLDYLKRVQAGKNGKANNYFSDEEYRILLSALAREREVCKKVDRDCGGEPRLLRIVESIERKIAKMQYSEVTRLMELEKIIAKEDA